MIQAGFYECDITPPYGADRPADFYKRSIKKISDPLKIRVMALSDGKRKIALVGADNIGCGPAFLRTLKESLPGISIVFSSSHTHFGGNLRDKFPGIDEADPVIRRIVLDESVAHDANYYEFCLRQAVTAVTFAFEALQDVDFSFGSGRIENLIFNRRIRMKDGSVKTHAGKGNPDAVGYAGPVDDQLGVMGVWKKGTAELLGFAFNFSCHSCINLEGATSDYAGVTIETVRAVYGSGAGAVFMYGASGDVTQIDNMSLKKDTGKPVCIKLGRVIGAEAVKILAAADRGPIENLNILSQVYVLRRNPLDPDEVRSAYEKIQAFEDSNDYKIAKILVMSDLIAKSESRPETELSVLQIGPLAIASTPGEMFAQFALDFKAQSNFPFTWMASLSTERGYIPTVDAFDPVTGGGYEASTAEFVPETGEEITKIVSELEHKLTPEKAPEPELVPTVKSTWGYNFKRKNLSN